MPCSTPTLRSQGDKKEPIRKSDREQPVSRRKAGRAYLKAIIRKDQCSIQGERSPTVSEVADVGGGLGSNSWLYQTGVLGDLAKTIFAGMVKEKA